MQVLNTELLALNVMLFRTISFVIQMEICVHNETFLSSINFHLSVLELCRYMPRQYCRHQTFIWGWKRFILCRERFNKSEITWFNVWAADKSYQSILTTKCNDGILMSHRLVNNVTGTPSLDQNRWGVDYQPNTDILYWYLFISLT